MMRGSGNMWITMTGVLVAFAGGIMIWFRIPFSPVKEVPERHFHASVGESGIDRKRDFYERGFFPPSRSHSQIRGALRLYRNAENVLSENEIS